MADGVILSAVVILIVRKILLVPLSEGQIRCYDVD
jgi:hypothetical protein